MARARLIKPGFFEDSELALVSPLARLVYIGLWVQCCDDYGAFLWSERLIFGAIFPQDADEATMEDLRSSLGALERSGRIVRFAAQGQTYGQVLSWDRHQKVDHPSKTRFPACPDTLATPSRDSRDTLATPSREGGDRDAASPRDTLARLSRDSRLEVEVGVGVDVDDEAEPPKAPQGAPAGRVADAPGPPTHPGGDPLPFPDRLYAALQAPRGTDPDETAARERLHEHWRKVCAGKRLSVPPWKAAREGLTRAVLWTHDLALADGVPPEEALDRAVSRLQRALSASAALEKRRGCGERIGETREVWGTGLDWEETLGTLLGRAGPPRAEPSEARGRAVP